MKHLVFVCRYVELFRSYALPINSGPQLVNLRFFTAKFLGMEQKTFSKVGSQP